jgi:hypothetical protein
MPPLDATGRLPEWLLLKRTTMFPVFGRGCFNLAYAHFLCELNFFEEAFYH